MSTETIAATQTFLDKSLTFLSQNFVVILIVVVILLVILIPIVKAGMQSDEFLLMCMVVICSTVFFVLLMYGISKGSISTDGFLQMINDVCNALKDLWSWAMVKLNKG